MQTFKLTRLAPTPSGYLHLGNIYSFLITSCLAKKHGAKILLRIDDLDQDRVKKSYLNDIFDTLDFLEINFDLGPKNLQEFKNEYSQSHRANLYQEALEKLKEKKSLYACNCSRRKIAKSHPKGYYTGFCRDKNLDFNQPETAWRIKTPTNQPIWIKDLIQGKIKGLLSGELFDFVVRKKDGKAAYQLASVIDDDYYGVDLVVRGKDLYGSSLAQVHLSPMLNGSKFAQATFYHHPLLVDQKRKKMSKSAGATSIQYLRKSGKTSKAIYQLIGEYAQLPEPIYDLKSFQNAFVLKGLSFSP
ncbi:glutamate--tRNA ligase family protein [Pararhodonellum marinum]|uniref:glutamate--tRNA ligase family protein n=1 Tax=Pararhodonellum marinum TaxID=2755358 RepID=UPI00188ED7EA|nr:glutamate--tRNA ligase family protein [Pararhodonellum marinum]